MISVLLVDDHAVVRAGVAGMLGGEPDITIVGEAASGTEAVTAVAALRPDVVLMDLRLPGIDGATATAQVVAIAPTTRVVVLTTYATDADILRAVEAGARLHAQGRSRRLAGVGTPPPATPCSRRRGDPA